MAVRESTGTENSSFGFNRSFSSGYFSLMGILEGVILPWYPGICQAGVSTDRLAGNDHLEESPNPLQCENICDVALLIGGPYDGNSSDMLIPYVPTVPSGWTASSLYGFLDGEGATCRNPVYHRFKAGAVSDAWSTMGDHLYEEKTAYHRPFYHLFGVEDSNNLSFTMTTTRYGTDGVSKAEPAKPQAATPRPRRQARKMYRALVRKPPAWKLSYEIGSGASGTVFLEKVQTCKMKSPELWAVKRISRSLKNFPVKRYQAEIKNLQALCNVSFAQICVLSLWYWFYLVIL